ncbi:restriction endonuclease subunit S [Actinacidiphila sp. ITFR-21]|uniref:restriction endonuclease subunit S n=1 Tax=Actinacidiphila sp. ITFR-21 TaxID=3075199 RepID=UPI00288AA795|nr:restriction endonuclease subunit S [Streptomyces sp. ITFR-21]WNI16869.1 restriction endonuclease subunit S [Streptomyces sp. ITFR-21]
MTLRTNLVDSEVPWLGHVPPGWTMKPLWSMFERIKDVDHPDERMLSVFREFGVIAKDSRDNLNQTAENRSIYQLVHPGWLVANRMKAWQGSVGISSLRGIVSGHYICFAPRHGEDNRYLNWLLRSTAYANGYSLLSRGVRIGQAEIDNDQLRLMPILLPPVQEQRTIADYLDRETARIDTLIEEQQRLVEMLRERRQAIIDLAFSMLESPRIQLRRHIRFLTSGSRGWGDYYADEGERFVRIGNLPRGNLDLRGDIQFVDIPLEVTEGSRTILKAEDLLFSITAYLGSVAVVGGDWVGAYVSQHVALCRLESEHMDSRFIGWFMLTTTGQDQLKEGAAGGAKMQLALDDIRGLRVPLAPINEQRNIAASLDERTAKIDTLIAETERFIELARERRSALITAAVTGQINVREAA